jgi:hypothetical protein
VPERISEKDPYWSWQRDAGFMGAPTFYRLSSPLLVYRVWGGSSAEIGSPRARGVCFSAQKPRTRSQAERLFAIWEYGNATWYVSTFKVLPGATVFVGRVDPGAFNQAGRFSPTQIFLMAPQVRLFVRKVGSAVRLLNDVPGHLVVPNRAPGQPGAARWS